MGFRQHGVQENLAGFEESLMRDVLAQIGHFITEACTVEPGTVSEVARMRQTDRGLRRCYQTKAVAQEIVRSGKWDILRQEIRQVVEIAKKGGYNRG